MPDRPGDGAGAAALVGHQGFPALSGHHAVMDLVALQDGPVGQGPALAGQYFVRPEVRPHGEKPQPGSQSRPAFDRVVDESPEHLVAAADAEHSPAGGSVARLGHIEALLTQPGQVGDRRTGPG
jgi:hypothetical protein